MQAKPIDGKQLLTLKVSSGSAGSRAWRWKGRKDETERGLLSRKQRNANAKQPNRERDEMVE